MPENVHGVILTTTKNKVRVSCKCRLTPGLHAKAGKLNADPIGVTRNIEETRELYNNPENHWAPFTERDEIGHATRIQDRSASRTQTEDLHSTGS